MKIIAIIAEYNPFHNGHAYQLSMARKMTGADAVVVIMSGDYVERGEPALIEKFNRANMALKNGADLVLELPVLYATASAEIFAEGAVSILNALNCVDELVFGAEDDDLTLLQKIADILAEEPVDYKNLLNQYQRKGLSYPQASSEALTKLFPDENLSKVLAKPNNILAIQYLKALHHTDSRIKPVLIKRIGAGYHETQIVKNAEYSSATAIRAKLLDKQLHAFPERRELPIPETAYFILKKEWENNRIIDADDLSLPLHTKLILEREKGYDDYLDISKELSDKIRKNLDCFMDFSQFCETCKSKDITYVRISRCFLHIYLNITRSLLEEARRNGYAFYARPLGFTDTGRLVFSQIARCSAIPLISKLADKDRILTQSSAKETAQKLLWLDIQSATLYETLLTAKTGKPVHNEYTKQLIL